MANSAAVTSVSGLAANISHHHHRRRQSHENNMDSHGSSLTNSSKQDDEDDDYELTSSGEKVSVQETTVSLSNLKTKPAPPPLLSHHNATNYNTFSTTNMSPSTNATYTCYTSPSHDTGTNELKNTIDELSLKMTSETAKYNSYQANAAANKLRPSSIYTSATTSISNNYANHHSVNNSNTGLYHQKYQSCAYDPQYESNGTTSTSISTNIRLPSIKTPSSIVGEQQNDMSSTLNTGTDTKGNHMRRNKKPAKTSASERSAYGNTDGSNSVAYSVYYNEDVDKLLQFITSSNGTSATSNTSGSNKNKNKVTHRIGKVRSDQNYNGILFF